MKERTIERLKMLAERTRKFDSAPASIPKDVREELSMMFSSTFKDFREFAELGMRFLGFDISDMQEDIAEYMQYGPRKRMVQAQRGEAKSTLAALYAVWSLIQDPTYRVLIISGGEKQASDVALLIIRLIEQWHLLCWLRPDSTRGDRTSVENYDVHCDLKGVDKTASISCVGITANLQGRRADLLIPDDIETAKNSLTQVMRDQLLLLSKDFAAICTHGHILYLGTPQTKESIYKTLRGRGFDVRIWPGRYPTPEELERYEPGTVAPMVLSAIDSDPSLQTGGGLDGNRGQPTDPVRYDEAALVEKELDFGPDGFSLQYMLDTALSDAQRTKIKLSDLIVAAFGTDSVPEVIQYSAEPRFELREKPECIKGEKLYTVASSSSEYTKFLHKVMVIDPAGNGGDEVAFAAGGVANSYIHIFTIGGLIGGMSLQNIDTIIDLCVDMDVKTIKVEANMGHGTVSMLILAQLDKRGITDIGVEDYYAKGQKERRIIDTISPVTRRHRLVVHQRAIDDDWYWSQKHARDKRTVTSGLYQLANITYDRGSLSKDDRADAVQGIVMHLAGMIAVDDEKEEQKRKELASLEFLNNPMGYDQPKQRKRKRRR